MFNYRPPSPPPPPVLSLDTTFAEDEDAVVAWHGDYLRAIGAADPERVPALVQDLAESLGLAMATLRRKQGGGWVMHLLQRIDKLPGGRRARRGRRRFMQHAYPHGERQGLRAYADPHFPGGKCPFCGAEDALLDRGPGRGYCLAHKADVRWERDAQQLKVTTRTPWLADGGATVYIWRTYLGNGSEPDLARLRSCHDDQRAWAAQFSVGSPERFEAEGYADLHLISLEDAEAAQGEGGA